MGIKTIKPNTTGALPVVATLRKGDVKQTNKPGRELPHFRIDWHVDNPNFLARPHKLDEAKEIFVDLYGETPTFIPNIAFLQNHIDDAFPHFFEQWSNKSDVPRCTTRCDGETRSVWMDGGKIQHGSSPCVCDSNNPTCKARGQLFFMLPEWSQATAIGGLFRLTTTSIVDMINISGALNSVGNLYGKFFHIYREPMVVKNIVHHMVKIAIADGESQQMAQRLLASSQVEPLQLSSGEYEELETVVLEPRMKVTLEDGVKYYYLQTLDKSRRFVTDEPERVLHFIPFASEYEPGIYEGDSMPQTPIIAQVKRDIIYSAELEQI